MQPEQAIESWRRWASGLADRPVILGPLSGGRSNRSFLLASGAGKMVLRLHGPESALPGGSRAGEFDIWRAASRAGIAPPLLHVDERRRFAVSAYIDGGPPPVAAHVGQAITLLQRCHRLDVAAPVIDYTAHLERYWELAESRGRLRDPALRGQREAMFALLASLLESGAQTGLCHHDPVVANFVGGPGRLYLIDWEYAARGLLVMDYAALATEWMVGDDSVCQRAGLAPELLCMAKTLYRHLCALWAEVTAAD